MYFAVILSATKTKLVIPIQWISSIDIAQVFNIGLVKSKQHKIFHCDDMNADPNFRLDIRTDFNENGGNPPACYIAQILCCFRKSYIK